MTNQILLVDDDENDVFLMQHAMLRAGVANPIHVASDGQQAIDYFKGAGRFANRQAFPLPCLVLLDLKLPYVMGLDVLKWIRHQPELTAIVVILSASGDEADIATAYRLGANGYLVKPSKASKLQDMAKAIKDFWLTQNTPPPESCFEAIFGGLACSYAPSLVGKRSPPVRVTREPWANHAAVTL